jgi:hypothetical protein
MRQHIANCCVQTLRHVGSHQTEDVGFLLQENESTGDCLEISMVLQRFGKVPSMLKPAGIFPAMVCLSFACGVMCFAFVSILAIWRFSPFAGPTFQQQVAAGANHEFV